MTDLELYRAAQLHRREGKDVVMAIVVESKGSSPREAGAKMLILPNGEILGTIGGGEGEAKVHKAGLEILWKEKNSQILKLYLTAEAGSSSGDICGGQIAVLLEYLPAF